MGTKLEQSLSHVQTMATSSSASTSSPKISMFAAKSGFVIPKNKLSGSLVPIFRGGKKLGGNDTANEESTKQVHRRTKWGPDLTQDAAVRKGRALAYQIRVDQISQQLELGILKSGKDQDSPLASQISDRESPVHQINKEKSELLELERLEAIGEILKLNPSYKAPADYKPLLKEAKVPIPIKEYPGYNFIGLIFGTANDTQKRLEKETGCKIRVYGTKADAGVKGEITSSDGKDIHGAYEELYVLVSADTYEKVDAAVALIELLVTPVSVNPAAVSMTSTTISGDDLNVINLSQGTTTAFTVPALVINRGVVQPILGPVSAPRQGQFQPYPGPWFPTGPPQISGPPPSGLITYANPSVQGSPPFNPSNMPSLFGPRPVPQNPSMVTSRPQPSLQVFQRANMPQLPTLGHIGPPRNPPMPSLQLTPAYPNLSTTPPFSGNQSTPTGPLKIARPLVSSLPQSAPPTFSDRPLTPTGWSQAPACTPASLGPSSMAWIAPPLVPPQGHHHVASQPIMVSGAPPLNISAGNMVSPVSRALAPQLAGAAANRPIAAPAFTPVPQPQVGFSPLLPPSSLQSSSIALMQPVMAQTTVTNPSPNLVRSTPILSHMISVSMPPPPPHSAIPSSVRASAPSFTPIKPPSVTALKPQHPHSSDFTFQPHRPHNPASQVIPRPGSQPAPQNVSHLHQPALPPRATQAPPFHPAMHNQNPLPAVQGFPRPQVSIQMPQPQPQPQPQMPMAFRGNPTVPPVPLRHAVFRNPSPATPTSPVPQMGPRYFNPAPQRVNSAGHLHPRVGNPVQLQQNFPAAATRPHSLLAPNQQFRSHLSFASGKPASGPSGAPQIYDPFLPTSVSFNHQLGSNPAKPSKQESDPEYEDLMASVGVK